jgi:septum formation protein
MTVTRLLLASQSPARLATLRSAGIEPLVRSSGVDEDAALADAMLRYRDLSPADAALLLARAKAEAVASGVTDDDVVVLGCDSVLELDGEIHGKPVDADEATKRWARMRNRSGTLHTGHWLVDTRASGTGGTVGATASTVVYFADVSDAELEAYIGSGEPLDVAGAFTVDGLGGPFVRRIDGDHHNVVGVSLPLLRTLLADVDVSIVDLWNRDVTH